MTTPASPQPSFLRTALWILVIAGILGAVGYLVARNAQWRERATVAEQATDKLLLELDASAARTRTTLDVADSLRTALAAVTRRANTVAGRSHSLRQELDSLKAVAAPLEQVVVVQDSVIGVQDSVIAAKDTALRIAFRVDSVNVAAITRLTRDVAVATDTIRYLRRVIADAPVMQVTRPKPSFWRGVALGAAAVIAVKVAL